MKNYAHRKNIWGNIIFFAVTTLVAVIGTPLYYFRYGISLSEIVLFVSFFVLTGLGITVGYHRQFAHATFKTNKWVRFFFLFFGAGAFEQSALEWASQHRDHHRFVDTDRDPYSIKKGFFYAHMGWLVFWEHELDFDNAKDLKKDPLVLHQHQYYGLWAVTAGILLPVLIGALTGHALGAFILSVCLRLTLVYHATFCINSVCHMFGKPTFDIYATARDHWLVALITFGEGYHNFHHRFPSDYRNGVMWYHWDPSKWLIAGLARLGWVWDLNRVSRFRILEAKLSAENRMVSDTLKSVVSPTMLPKVLDVLSAQSTLLKKRMRDWEAAATHYRDEMSARIKGHGVEMISTAKNKMSLAKAKYDDAYERWNTLTQKKPVDLESALLSMAA